MKVLFMALVCLGAAFAATDNWKQLSKTDQHKLLWDLDYLEAEHLPPGTSKVDMIKDAVAHPEYAAYAEKVLEKLEEIDRESIDQSPYLTFGDEELIDFFLLVKEGKVLGAMTYLYQDGRDQEGRDSDVNWSAHIMFDGDAEFFKDEDGVVIDDLRFEWSGH